MTSTSRAGPHRTVLPSGEGLGQRAQNAQRSPHMRSNPVYYRVLIVDVARVLFAEVSGERRGGEEEQELEHWGEEDE